MSVFDQTTENDLCSIIVVQVSLDTYTPDQASLIKDKLMNDPWFREQLYTTQLLFWKKEETERFMRIFMDDIEGRRVSAMFSGDLSTGAEIHNRIYLRVSTQEKTEIMFMVTYPFNIKQYRNGRIRYRYI